jgi:hypothetical protein
MSLVPTLLLRAKKSISIAAVLLIAAIHALPANAFDLNDLTSAQLNGMWWVPTESGWGASIVGQGGTLFVVVYTYDSTKKPIWYVASGCTIYVNYCRGDLYQVTGGTALGKPWDGSSKSVSPIGTFALIVYTEKLVEMQFSSSNPTLYPSFTKLMDKQIFGAVNTAAGTTTLPIRFNEIVISGSSANQMVGGRCVYTISVKNLGGYAVTPKLVFDATESSNKLGEFTFGGGSLASNSSTSYSQDMLVDGKFLVCGDFKMAWNPAKSATTR